MVDTWDEVNRPLKAHVRNLIASSCGKWKKVAIMFPAGGAHDVRAFLNAGVLTRKTALTAIEFDSNVARQTWVSLFNLGMARKTTMHHGSAHNLKVTSPVDFAFLDFCGPGTIEEMDWIRYLVPNIVGPTSDVLVTFKANHRGAGYFSAFQKRVVGTEAFRHEMKLILKTPTTKTNLDGSITVCESSYPTLRALACVRLALRQVFSGYTFDLKSTVYRDLDLSKGTSMGSREMLLIHLSRFSKIGNSIINWH